MIWQDQQGGMTILGFERELKRIRLEHYRHVW